jgi:hypothetical protein
MFPFSASTAHPKMETQAFERRLNTRPQLESVFHILMSTAPKLNRSLEIRSLIRVCLTVDHLSQNAPRRPKPHQSFLVRASFCSLEQSSFIFVTH